MPLILLFWEVRSPSHVVAVALCNAWWVALACFSKRRLLSTSRERKALETTEQNFALLITSSKSRDWPVATARAYRARRRVDLSDFAFLFSVFGGRTTDAAPLVAICLHGKTTQLCVRDVFYDSHRSKAKGAELPLNLAACLDRTVVPSPRNGPCILCRLTSLLESRLTFRCAGCSRISYRYLFCCMANWAIRAIRITCFRL